MRGAEGHKNSECGGYHDRGGGGGGIEVRQGTQEPRAQDSAPAASKLLTKSGFVPSASSKSISLSPPICPPLSSDIKKKKASQAESFNSE
jgi:hypothetical protein